MTNNSDTSDSLIHGKASLWRWQTYFHAARSTEDYKKVFYMDNPLVTVCVSTSDRCALLFERAVKSIIRQTYENMQVIVIGDHCEDDTAQLIASLNDKRFTFENLAVRGPYPPPGLHRWMVAGTYPANRALELATGHLITHLDEDDTYEPDRIAILVRELQQAKVDLVFHPFWWEDDGGKWFVLGNGTFARGETSTGTVLYHNWFKRILADVYAYKKNEPGDWNRFQRMIDIGASTMNVNKPLSSHYRFPLRDPFVPKNNENFI